MVRNPLRHGQALAKIENDRTQSEKDHAGRAEKFRHVFRHVRVLQGI